MLSFSRVLLCCAVGLLSASPVLAGPPPVSAGDLLGQVVNLEIFSSVNPDVLLQTPPQPVGGYVNTIPFNQVFGSGSAAKKGVFSVDITGKFTLVFPANANLDIFDGAELSFNSGDAPLPFFGLNANDYVNPFVTLIPPTSSPSNYNCGPYTAPTTDVEADGSISINIVPASVLATCGVSYSWGSDPEIPGTIPPCSQPGGVCGDPQFTGFVGQSYQVHGVSGSVYNVLSTPHFQFNALFSYLESGKCRWGTMCFSHPGNYFGEIGMLLKNEVGAVSRLRVVAGPVDTGMRVLLNDQALETSVDVIQIGDSSLVFGDAFGLTVQTPEFSLKLSNSDMFLNQDISVNTPLMQKIQTYKQAAKANDSTAPDQLAALPHGLLGQTWLYKTYPNRWKYIQGQLFDYVLADGVFGTSFNFNRFAQ